MQEGARMGYAGIERIEPPDPAPRGDDEHDKVVTWRFRQLFESFRRSGREVQASDVVTLEHIADGHEDLHRTCDALEQGAPLDIFT